MKFVETPSFWYPHVDRAACTNFSTRTVKLRPSERQKILLFSFSSFFSFSFFFFVSSSTNSFSFLSFLLFFIPFSHFIFSSFLLLISLPFSLLLLSFPFFFFPFFLYKFFLFLLAFSPPFWIIIDRMVKGGSFLPLSSCHMCGPCFSFLISLFLNSLYSIIHHVANCEPHIQVHHMALAMCHSLRVPCGIPLTMSCVIRHPTPRKT